MLEESADYRDWLGVVKSKLRSVQLKAAVTVNSALLVFYWELGAEIVEKQKERAWGDGFLSQLSQDLMADFPEMKGFSYRNLRYIRQWYLFYREAIPNWQHAVAKIEDSEVAQITRIPWGHNLVVVAKYRSLNEALYYVQHTIQHGWSRNVLTHQIESKLWEREGKAIANFQTTLPTPP